MAADTLGQRWASLCVRRAALFGVLWCIVPTLIAWTVVLRRCSPCCGGVARAWKRA
jgi:hypothetical protein